MRHETPGRRVVLHRGTAPPWRVPNGYRGLPIKWFIANSGDACWLIEHGDPFGWEILDNQGRSILDGLQTLNEVRHWAEGERPDDAGQEG